MLSALDARSATGFVRCPKPLARCSALQQRRASHALVGSLSASCRARTVRVTAHGSTAQGAEAVQEDKKRMRPGERKGKCNCIVSEREPLVNNTVDNDKPCMWARQLMCRLACAGFVEEMRIVAMKLHTKDQAPKEGEQAAAPKPFPKVGTSCSHTRCVAPYCVL